MTDSKTLLQELITEIEATDEKLLPPYSEKEDGDKLLSILTDPFIKKIYNLAMFYRREGMRMEVDLKSTGLDPAEDASHNQYRQKYDTLMQLFWLTLRNSIDAWKPKSVGIRKNWEIVDHSEVTHKSPLDALRDFLED